MDRRVYAEIDSTNAEAARLAPSLMGPAWLLAHHQTAGRGRRGRAWADPVGNFAATLVLRPTGTPAEVALRSFVAALALHETLVTVTGRAEPFALKWPNDVLLNGGKVAGILLESIGQGNGVGHLCIGIGVNLVAAPPRDTVEAGAVPPVALMPETGALVTPEEFLDVLAPSYAHWETQLTTYGFAPIRAAWLTRAAKIGQVITARTGTESVTGTFETVDETGNLVLTSQSGRRAIPAADIFF